RMRLSPRTRAFIVGESAQLGVTLAARNSGVSRRTVYRWRGRAPDFSDRSCRPHRSPRRSADALEASVLALRLDSKDGPDRIGPALGLHPSTVHRILRRHGAHRLSHLFPKPRRSFGSFAPLRPGELVGLDIKSFGSIERGGGRAAVMHHPEYHNVGWRHLHVAIDMATRLVFAEFRATLGGADGAAFLDRALAFFAGQGIRVERVLSDNGSAYRSFVFAAACHAAGIRHTRTKVRHPWTNGRAERFIGTIQRECAYRDQFTSDAERALAIALFVPWYNRQRPHRALKGLTPADWLDRWRVTQLSGALS
ncbi:MAG TPA: IS481 family transposase, partial [Ktedonobacterales bacterium]|nr:IS481 family transposase [Ktedonobacterales bacterium]